MTRIESVVQIEAPVETVWDILTDSSYIVKLFRDAVMVTADPPGRSVVGQRYHLIGKAGRRKVEFFLEVTELVPESTVVTRQRPGGLFRRFMQRTVLERSADATRASTVFDYELALGYLGKVLNVVLVERLVRDNLTAYSQTLKELSELLPLPA
jgi:uncharacterized protein YndB with AHSA1/START domain